MYLYDREIDFDIFNTNKVVKYFRKHDRHKIRHLISTDSKVKSWMYYENPKKLKDILLTCKWTSKMMIKRAEKKEIRESNWSGQGWAAINLTSVTSLKCKYWICTNIYCRILNNSPFHMQSFSWGNVEFFLGHRFVGLSPVHHHSVQSTPASWASLRCPSRTKALLCLNIEIGNQIIF